MTSHNHFPSLTLDGTRLLEHLLGPGLPEELGEPASDLALAARAALEGGESVLRHYVEGGDLEIREKDGDGPVTAADHASNRAILHALADRRPGDAVLSEESSGGGEASDAGAAARARAPGRGSSRLWVVDPLDGTKEFLARNGEFSVMVGLAEQGACVLGAVYQPALDLLFLGLAEGGAWAVAYTRQRPQARRLRPTSGAGRRLRFVRSRSHADPRLDRFEGALGEVEVVLSGSVGIKCALIADGRADLYVHPVPYLKEWDTCAPEAVLRGAGGRVTDCGGTQLSYGKEEPRQSGGIFAAKADVWERVAPLVEELAAPPFVETEGSEAT